MNAADASNQQTMPTTPPTAVDATAASAAPASPPRPSLPATPPDLSLADAGVAFGFCAPSEVGCSSPAAAETARVESDAGAARAGAASVESAASTSAASIAATASSSSAASFPTPSRPRRGQLTSAYPTSIPLTARLTVPLPIPVSTDLVRKPKPQHGIDSLHTLCAQPLAQHKKHVSGAIQALVTRSGAVESLESGLVAAQSALAETDRQMGTLVDGLVRLDQMMHATAHSVTLPNGAKKIGWIKRREKKQEGEGAAEQKTAGLANGSSR